MEPSTNLSSACWWLADEWDYFDRQTLYFCCHQTKKNKSTNAQLFLLVAYVKLVGCLWVGLHTSPRYHNVSHYHIHATLSYSFLLSLCGGSRLPSSVCCPALSRCRLDATICGATRRRETRPSLYTEAGYEQVHRPPIDPSGIARRWWVNLRTLRVLSVGSHQCWWSSQYNTHDLPTVYTDSCLCWDASNSRPTVINHYRYNVTFLLIATRR